MGRVLRQSPRSSGGQVVSKELTETLLIAAWLFGWISATLYAAAFIGNVDNQHNSGDKAFPTFIVPLLFGWFWPAVVVMAIIVAPLAWLSDRATKRHDQGAQQ